MSDDFALREHQKWLNFLQPEGLVVSPRALVDKQVLLDAGTARELQERFRAALEAQAPADQGDAPPAITDFPAFAQVFLGWPAERLIGSPAAPTIPPELSRALPELGEVLAPRYALRDPQPAAGTSPWILLVHEIPSGASFDDVPTAPDTAWPASPTRKFIRLLHETSVPIGLIVNGPELRLVYAPSGESAGWITFPLRAMTEVDGRAILCGFEALLGKGRLFVGPREARLPAILDASRRYQAAVSTALAAQVLEALYELVRGFQEADDRTHGALLRELLAKDPDQIYGGLLTTLMRLVFVLYAEDRNLMPSDPLYREHYSVHGLALRLRKDADQNPDTMDQRFGAWAHLVTLFRAIHSGCVHPRMKMPARRGHLFDPERYPFLEGRTQGSEQLPAVPDGVVERVLQKLLILDGEKLSYRTLDVEQIGSVYETMMGFRLERATGPSIAIKAKKTNGAPTTIDLDELLAKKPAQREKWLKEATEQTLGGKKGAAALRAATSIDDLVAALGSKVAFAATPRPVPKGAIVLQPSDARRRSGSHYTPRSLTAPIVTKALRPAFERLSEDATPDAVLDLKVCDPAMGSGAFLVESCRQLADRLVLAWRRHHVKPALPLDEDEILHARRLVAQRCLYGVDVNPVAVDLAKLSLWLVTLAKDHAFTFLDHALRHGDALVGLDDHGLRAFHWDPKVDVTLVTQLIQARVKDAVALRKALRDAPDGTHDTTLRDLWKRSEAALDDVRLLGDLVLTAFFGADKPKKREYLRQGAEVAAREWINAGGTAGEAREALVERTRALRRGGRPLFPFHWPIEFPEVFGRANPGFDAIVGNPPFAGKNTLIAGHQDEYPTWLKLVHDESHGNADLVAHFSRRAFTRTRDGGAFGLIATNTIAQGDTRGTGLRWICTHGGTIFAAKRRHRWAGGAAVVVSVVHVIKGPWTAACELNGESCGRITAFLVTSGGHDDPARLVANSGKAFVGSIVLGMGFTFDDTDKKGIASPIAEMHRLIKKDPRNAERIFPYIGGEEVNTDPRHAHHRYVINFGEISEEEARQWPDLMKIVEERVRPERALLTKNAIGRQRAARWWRYGSAAPKLMNTIRGMERVLVIARVGQQGSFAFLPSRMVFSEQLIVFPFESHAPFAALQSRPHEVWTRLFASTMKNDLRYTPSDCFETFPFPVAFETNSVLDAAGQAYYDHRAALMIRRNEGLTKIYNLFHDPDETDADVLTLRTLHDAMDRAVLDAYGWTDLRPSCDFFPVDDGEDDDEETARPKKRKFRYRWPDATQDLVLARLLALNADRAKAERAAGLVPPPRSAGDDDDGDAGDEWAPKSHVDSDGADEDLPFSDDP